MSSPKLLATHFQVTFDARADSRARCTDTHNQTATLFMLTILVGNEFSFAACQPIVCLPKEKRLRP